MNNDKLAHEHAIKETTADHSKATLEFTARVSKLENERNELRAKIVNLEKEKNEIIASKLQASQSESASAAAASAASTASAASAQAVEKLESKIKDLLLEK